ncbi:hypothetical protein AU194_08730 [Mycobacterium sp. GA-2829]|nr:hypothetical protein AU194_08730 [Mycobacterium sp. GA-2829]
MTSHPYTGLVGPSPRSGAAGRMSIAFVVPMKGPEGLYAPSCLACAELAVTEINSSGGILGLPVDLIPIDGAQPAARVGDQIARLVDARVVDAVAGWHSSDVRRAITKRVGGRVVYAFAAEHEDGDDTRGLFMVGERAANQLQPAMNWMHQALGVRHWAFVGNDYIYPREAVRSVRAGMPRTATLDMTTFVPRGTTDFTEQLDAIEAARPDAVYLLLIGADAVHFNRQFGERGLGSEIPRLATTVEESALLAGDVGANEGLFSAKAYFDTIDTLEGHRFSDRYYAHFGAVAPPLNGVGESCYEALHLLSEVARESGSLDVEDVDAVRSGFFYESPRGLMRIWGNVVSQDVYIAAADGLEFTVQEQIAHT